jgi:hypothetical protein
VPCTSSKIAGAISATNGQQQHQRRHVRGRAVEELPIAADAADEHRRAHDEQDVAQDRADERRLDDLLEPLVEREERDDQLRPLPNVTFKKPPMPGPDRAASSSGRTPHQRGGRDHAGGRRHEDRRRARVHELKRDRHRDERDQQVRPAGAAQQGTGAGRTRPAQAPRRS